MCERMSLNQLLANIKADESDEVFANQVNFFNEHWDANDI